MTDFRALCAELLSALENEGYAHWTTSPHDDELCLRARAALAEPQPAADGEVAELVTWLRRLERSPLGLSMDGHANLTRAAELLERLSAQPTDEELDELYFDLDATEVQSWRAFARAVLARWGTPNLAETRSSLEPIPVSERLPKVGDCASWPDQPDADAWCWSGWNRTKSLLEPIPLSERLPEAGDCAPWCDCEDADPWCWCGKLADGGWEWFQFSASVLSSHFVFRGFTHWLPAHALPIPGENGK